MKNGALLFLAAWFMLQPQFSRAKESNGLEFKGVASQLARGSIVGLDTGPAALAHRLLAGKKEIASSNGGSVVAAVGSFIYRSALDTAASITLSQMGLGFIIACTVVSAGLKVSDIIDVWASSIPVDLRSTEVTGFEGPTRKDLFATPNISSTRGLGVILHW